jgi:hypothetical protein
MNWVVAKIKWVMLLTGALTCAMLYMAVKPDEAVDFLFDRTLGSSLDELFVRGWASLGGLVGALTIYGAFAPQARTLAMTVASISKLTFLGLMLAYGREYLGEKMSFVLGLDVVMVALFGTFALGVFRARRGGSASRPPPPAARSEPSARPMSASASSAFTDGPPGPIPAQPQRQVVAAGKRLGPTNR